MKHLVEVLKLFKKSPNPWQLLTSCDFISKVSFGSFESDILELEFDLSEPRHGPRMIKIRPRKEVKKSTDSSSGWKFQNIREDYQKYRCARLERNSFLNAYHSFVIMTFKLLFLQSVGKQSQAAAALVVYLALYVLIFTLTNIFKLDLTRSNCSK